MSIFRTNCTAPTDIVAFVTTPEVRGTLQILWSCLLTLLLCTWTVLHLNVPQQSHPRTTCQSVIRRCRRVVTKLKWMLVTLIFPEYTLGKAYNDFCSVKVHTPDLEDLAREDGVRWSKAHTFLANMGGFAVSFENLVASQSLAAASQSDVRSNHGTHPEAMSDRQSPNTQDGTEQPLQMRTHGSYPQVSPLEHAGPSILHQARNGAPVSAGDRISVFSDRHSLSGASGERTGFESDQHQNTDVEARAEPGMIELTEIEPQGRDLTGHSIEVPAQLSPIEDVQTLSTTGGEPHDRKGLRCDIETSSLRLTDEYKKQDHARRYRGRQRLQHDVYAQRQERSLASIGDGTWLPCTQNQSLLISALDTIDIEDSLTNWERRRYVNVWYYWYDNALPLQGNIWILDACQLLRAREIGSDRQVTCPHRRRYR